MLNRHSADQEEESIIAEEVLDFLFSQCSWSRLL
jgi:hypothetical protein